MYMALCAPGQIHLQVNLLQLLLHLQSCHPSAAQLITRHLQQFRLMPRSCTSTTATLPARPRSCGCCCTLQQAQQLLLRHPSQRLPGSCLPCSRSHSACGGQSAEGLWGVAVPVLLLLLAVVVIVLLVVVARGSQRQHHSRLQPLLQRLLLLATYTPHQAPLLGKELLCQACSSSTRGAPLLRLLPLRLLRPLLLPPPVPSLCNVGRHPAAVLITLQL